MNNSTPTFRTAKGVSLILLLCASVAGCISIDKNSDTKYTPTDPQAVDIIQVTPYRPYQEIGKVDARWFDDQQTTEMYQSIREQAADEGADAVILADEGTENTPFVGNNLWAEGVAIRYNAAAQ